MSNGLKLMLLSVGTLITCIVVTVAMHMAKVSRKTGTVYAERLNGFYEDINRSDLTMYDGIEVYGSDVVNLIKKELGGYEVTESGKITITVITSNSPYKAYSYTNGRYVSEIQNFTDPRYIKPLNLYQGMVVYNENQVLTQLIFTVR